MKTMYICITILTYFHTDNLDWQVLWGTEKYLLNSFYEKFKNKVCLNVCSKESVSFKDKQITYITVSF